MKGFLTIIQLILAKIDNWLRWFIGGYDHLLYVLLMFVIINYITFIMCSIVDKKKFSSVGLKGIFQKVLIFILVGIGNMLDTQVISTRSALRIVIIFFYLYNEGISILKNAEYLGMPIPAKLKTVLKQLHSIADQISK